MVADSENQTKDVTEDKTLQNLNMAIGRSKKGAKRKFADQNRTQKKIIKTIIKPITYCYKDVKVDPKEYYDFISNCTQKCSETISSEMRKQQFGRFWSLGSYDWLTHRRTLSLQAWMSSPKKDATVETKPNVVIQN